MSPVKAYIETCEALSHKDGGGVGMVFENNTMEGGGIGSKLCMPTKHCKSP